MFKLENEGGDYLKRKLDNKASYIATSGVTEQDRFNNLATDADRLEAIEYNNVSGAVAIPFLMGVYGIADPNQAIAMFGGIQLQSIEDNSKACKSRFENKAKGWFPILFTFFEPSVAENIIKAVDSYFFRYTEYAHFGQYAGDTEEGLLDFINKTGNLSVNGVTLEDYPLISGTDYTAVQSVLTTYFY